MPANILNLHSYHVKEFHEEEHDYHIKAETKQQIVSCPNCHHIELEGFGRRLQNLELSQQRKKNSKS